MSPRTFSRMIVSLAGGGLFLGCAGGGPMESVPTGPPVVAFVRLFARGEDVSGHIALGEGETLRIEIRLYQANGDRILSADGEVQLTFEPSTLAVAVPVTDSPLLKDVTATAVRQTPGGIFVMCDQTKLICTRRFGPFDTLIH